MAVIIKIKAVDRTANIRMTSIEQVDSLPARTDTLQFEMVLTTTEVVAGVRPEAGNEIELIVDGTVEFAGEVTIIEETHLINPDAYNYQITCNDWSRRMDRLLVAVQEIGPDEAGTIIKSILTEFAGEFAVDLTQIGEGVVVPEQQFDYVPVTSVLDQLANLSGYVWYVDQDKIVHFVSPPSFLSPLTGNTYDVDTDLLIGDFNWNEDISQIKNRIYLKDALVPDAGERTDVFISDGVGSFFKLYQEPEGVDSTTIKSTPPGGAEKIWNVALDPLTTDDATLKGDPDTAFLCILNIGVRFPLRDDGTPYLGDGEVVEVTTTPMRDDIIFMVEDTDSQAMMADREGCTLGVDGCGIFEHVESLGDVRLGSQDAAEAFGTILLNQSAWPEIMGTFITQQLGGWKAGQTFDLSSSKRDLFDAETYWKSGEVTKIDIAVWVQQVTKRILIDESSTTAIIEWTVEFANRALPG